VLVHGDRAGWRPVAEILEAAGHSAHAPALSGYGERAHLASADTRLSDHVAEVVDFILSRDLDDVVLAGHSYGGMVITGAAERVAARLRHLVYVDALAPRDGESALDISPAWRREEILELARTRGGGVWVPPRQPGPGAGPGTPLGTLTEPVRLGNAAAAALPRTFVYCSSPPAPMIGPSADRARNDPTWRFHEFACGHAVQHEAPRELAAVLLGAMDTGLARG
jgi:pimeloyl-ACP methyl ester carboxylesterase